MMDLKEIRESGLLELYVIGTLSEDEKREVQKVIEAYPELQKDLKEIERSLEAYANAHRVNPSPATKSKVLDAIRKSSSPPKTVQKPQQNKAWMLAASFLGIISLGLLLWALQNRQSRHLLQNQFDQLTLTCDSLQQEQNLQLAQYLQLNDTIHDIVLLTPTEAFPDTDIILYTNSQAQRNFLQIRNLPAITAQQSYQLWSIKDAQAPIPMNVFQQSNGVIEVGFEPGTNVYAITIEVAGGSQAPTLSNLIGTMTMAG